MEHMLLLEGTLKEGKSHEKVPLKLAEAVNTACYVQNRVLVVKPHNKTPYELLHGRTPILSFMRPFRCPVTILNTINHLGKSDGKADEGFLVRYSLNSKAFRVFNSRTRIVEENLHIRFSESTLNVVCSGPDWLFDIDALTRTMNYDPIIAGTQSNGFIDPKCSNDDGSKPSSDDGKKVDEDPRKENELADMNNLDTTIQVSSIPTTRIHKDHPLDQVIGDFPSATQIRKMSKNLEERGAIGTKWVFKNKKDERGIVIRNKARLVAQGYTQEEGIDYDEVFSLVIKEEVYVCQPPGFEDPNFPDRVYKVEKHCMDYIKLLELVQETDSGSNSTTKAEYVVALSCCGQLWSTAMVKTINGEAQLHAKVDGKKIIVIESSIRRDLRLADEEGIDCEGLAIPTDPQHTPTIIQPSSSQPQKKQKPRKPKRKNTYVPHPSGPTESVTDEAVHKVLGDRLVRTATTSSSLEAEQDSGGGPRCQETIGYTTDQTRFESVSKQCTTLQNRVLDLEKTTTTQRNEIDNLKRRVKKLEKKNRSRTHKLKRLYKVGLMAKVESSGDEESLRGEEVFVVGQNENAVEEVVDAAQVKGIVFQEPGKSTTTTTTISSQQTHDKGKGIMLEEPVKPKKKDQIRLDEEAVKKLQAEFDKEERLTREKIASTRTRRFVYCKKDTLFQQLLEKRRKHFAAKRAKEKKNKPPTKSQHRKIMCTYLKNMDGYKLKEFKLKKFDFIQEMFDRAFKRVNTFEDFRTELVKGNEKGAGEELVQEITKKQKVEDDKEKAELK
nr:retrovirus-related Pol polyprotein from transposon TNT 1-94 [Tanacetum cinerariifolium]